MSDIQAIQSLSTADLLKAKSTEAVHKGAELILPKSFKTALGNVNDMQVDSEQAMSDIATGSRQRSSPSRYRYR